MRAGRCCPLLRMPVVIRCTCPVFSPTWSEFSLVISFGFVRFRCVTLRYVTLRFVSGWVMPLFSGRKIKKDEMGTVTMTEMEAQQQMQLMAMQHAFGTHIVSRGGAGRLRPRVPRGPSPPPPA